MRITKSVAERAKKLAQRYYKNKSSFTTTKITIRTDYVHIEGLFSR